MYNMNAGRKATVFMSKKRSGLRMDESDIVMSDLLYIIHDVVTDET